MIGCAGETVLAKFAEVYLKNRTQKSPKTQLYQGFASLQGVVPVAGVEPARVISPTDFESASSANSNTPAFLAVEEKRFCISATTLLYPMFFSLSSRKDGPAFRRAFIYSSGGALTILRALW